MIDLDEQIQMRKEKIFNASQFVPTQWESAEYKAKFANKFVKLVESNFDRSKFPEWFYRRLSQCFSHIAHYNIEGFYYTWFSDQGRKYNFILHTLSFPCYGDPGWTYSDVEKAIQAWLLSTDWPKKYAELADDEETAADRRVFDELKRKHGWE